MTMTSKIAKNILKMEKDKLMSEPEPDRDWELITALDIAIEALEYEDVNYAYGGYLECPSCHWFNPLDSIPFCPKCGAKMKGE